MPENPQAPADEKKKERLARQNQIILDCLKEYLAEARDTAKEWQDKADRAWDMIHGRIDWSHKTPQQSKVHLNRVGLAQEQIKAQVRQGLMNFDDWLAVETEAGFETTLLTQGEAKRMVLRGIDRTDPQAKITENIGIGAVENLLATKLQPVVMERRAPGGKVVKEFHVDHIPLNIYSYYCDAHADGGKPLYEFHEATMDKYKVLALADEKPSKRKPYILSKVKKLEPTTRLDEQKDSENRGNDISQRKTARRNMVVLHEFWGTILDDKGNILEWEKEDGSKLELKDVVITLANEECLISDPVPFPTWDGESYFIHTQLLKTNINVYGRSLLAPGVDMNRAEDELLNAGIDAGLKEGYNVNVLKVGGLADKRQAEGGIKYGMTLFQNNQLAPGEKLLESVSTGRVPQGLLMILDRVHASGAENMRLNEIALTGQLQSKQVRATEITASTGTIQGLFESIVADLEDVYIEKYCRKVFLIMLQHASLLTDNDLEYIFYGNVERAAAFKEALKKPKDIYEELSGAFRFRGKGVRSLAANAHQAQAIVQLFGMIASNPIILDVFERRGLDLTRFLDDIMKGFHLDIQKYYDNEVADFAKQRQLIREAAMAMENAQQQQNPGAGPQQAQPTAQAAGAGMQMGAGAKGV